MCRSSSSSCETFTFETKKKKNLHFQKFSCTYNVCFFLPSMFFYTIFITNVLCHSAHKDLTHGFISFPVCFCPVSVSVSLFQSQPSAHSLRHNLISDQRYHISRLFLLQVTFLHDFLCLTLIYFWQRFFRSRSPAITSALSGEAAAKRDASRSTGAHTTQNTRLFFHIIDVVSCHSAQTPQL